MVGNGDADSSGKLEVVIEDQEVRQIGSGGFHQTVDGSHVESVGGSYSLEVSGDSMVQSNGNLAMTSGAMGQMHLTGGTKFVVDVGPMGQLSLNGPGGFIKIDASGVTISGIMVKINSGGASSSGCGVSPETPETPAEAEPQEPLVADKFK